MAAVPEMLKVKQEPIDIDDEEEDDGELEALRMAALQTIRAKAQMEARAIPSIDRMPVNFQPPLQQKIPVMQKKPNYRQHQANPNLIAIVPVTPGFQEQDRTLPHNARRSDTQHFEKPTLTPQSSVSADPLPLPQNRYCSSLKTVQEKPKEVPAKFSRIDASDSESDDDDLLKGQVSTDEEDDADEHKNKVSGNGKSTDANINEAPGSGASLEDDDSLERLMDVMEQEFNQDSTKNVSKSASKKKRTKSPQLESPVKIKQEKIDPGYEKNLLLGENSHLKVNIKKEVADDIPVEGTSSLKHIKDKQIENDKCEQNNVVESSICESVPLSVVSEVNEEDKKMEGVCLKNKILDVNSSKASPLRIRSPREVNRQYLQTTGLTSNKLPVGVNKQNIYTNINDDSLSDSDRLQPISEVSQMSVVTRADEQLSRESYPSQSIDSNAIKMTSSLRDKSPSNRIDSYRRSRSPRRLRSHELSPRRQSLSPRSKDLSPRRYVSPSGRHSPHKRSISPRRRNNFSPRRSYSPRYSRSPVPYSASPSPVGQYRWRSISRSPLRRRTRSRSWSRSYSRSRSRSRSPYYKYVRRSPLRRSFSRSPRLGNRYFSPKRSLSPRRHSLSPGKRDYPPIRRGVSPNRGRQISVSPRRQRSPSPYWHKLSYDPRLFKRLSPSPLRSRKTSLSPRRKISPGKLSRVSISPRRSPIPYKSFSPKRTRTSLSPVPRQRRKSLSLERNNSPVPIQSGRKSRSRSPFSPVREIRSSISPRRRPQPLSRQNRNSLSPRRTLRTKSPSPLAHKQMQRHSPIGHREFDRGSFVSSKLRGRLGSPRRMSPVARRPNSPWNSGTVNLKRRSISPRRHPDEPKSRRISVSPSELTEIRSKHRSASPSRSPKRQSPRKNVPSPSGVRRSRSPSFEKNIQRKRSPLVVRHRRFLDNRKPSQYKDQSHGTSSQHGSVHIRSRSRSHSLSPQKEGVPERNRQPHIANRETSNRDQQNYRKVGGSQDYLPSHGYGQRRRKQFVERNKDRDNRDYRDNRRRERGNRDRNDRDRVRESRDLRERPRDKDKVHVADTGKDISQDKTEDKKREEEKPCDDKNVITDPVLEARRRKFESNNPVQPLNKKIRLRTKAVTENRGLTDLRDKISEGDRLRKADAIVKDNVIEEPVRTMKVDSSQSREIDQPLRIMKADSSKSEVELPSRMSRADSNKSLDKACNTDDVLDIGDSLLLMEEEEFDDMGLEDEELATERKKETRPRFTEEKVAEPKKKEKKQLKVKPMTRPTVKMDKIGNPSQPKEDNSRDNRFQEGRDERDFESARTKEECDLRAELSRRRAERLSKAGSVHESLPKRLLQSAFIGLMGGKSRLERKEKVRKSGTQQLQSQVHVQAPQATQAQKKERPIPAKSSGGNGGGRRVLLLNRATTHKAAVKICFPKGLETSSSQSESDDDDDFDDNDEEDVEEEEDQISEEDESTVLNKKQLQRLLPLHLRLGLRTNHSSQRKVKMGRRKQV